MALGKPNPELEHLRNQVEPPPNLDTVILNIQRLGIPIHSGFLFEKEGIFLLQQFCLLLSSSPSGKLYNGWKEFAYHLGLSREQIQCIEYNFQGMQDPTYYVLLAFCQAPDATVDKIVSACQQISRLDIINRIINPLSQFINNLLINHDNTSAIIRPECNPRVPLVLQPTIKFKSQRTGTQNNANSRKLGEKGKNNAILNIKTNYGSIVMLTFTKDGAESAKSVAKVFREHEPKIGVVILQEQEKFVYSRAEEFVDDCFNQVNYVIPILTNGYVDYINDSVIDAESADKSLDTKYVKYLYSLLRFEYFKNNCCNNRVRCIVPASEVSTILKSNLHPSLQAWFNESEINAFADNVLLKKF